MDGKSCPVLCVLDIEGDNVSVLEGVPEDISPGQVGSTVQDQNKEIYLGLQKILMYMYMTINLSLNLESLQAFWAPGDTGVVFVGWWHEPFRLGLMYSPTRR